MKNIMSSKTVMTVACLLVIGVTTPALAHFPWLNLSDYSPKKGAKIKGTVGWGHHFPMEGFLKQERVESVNVINPDKSSPEVTFTSELEWETTEGISSDGAYIVTAKRKPGFYTKTKTGHHSTSKKGLDDVLICKYSYSNMKAVATLGDDADVSVAAGLPLEIVLLDNPATILPGAYLHVRLLLEGKPYKGQIFGTYAGFSADSNTFAYVTSTDAEGYGRIRILQPGLWLLRSEHVVPYPDQEECDQEVYNTSLTFEVQ